MARWKIVGGPREYESTAEASDIAAGWAWDIEADGERRTVRVEIAATAEALYGYTDAERALRAVFDEDEPPGRLLLTTTNVQRL